MKKLLSTIKNAFDKTFPTTFTRAAIVAVIILPLIYGALYLWAFWDPYNKVDNLPIAFVNQDKGDTRDAEYKNLGNELADELHDNDKVKWFFVSEDEAIQGLQDKKYYSYILVPEDFTHQILSVDGNNPQKARLILKTRQASGVVAASIINRVGFEVTEKLGHKITEEYLDNIFIDSRNSTNDIKLAVDGSRELNDGLADAHKGSLDLKNGIEDASKGSIDLANGLHDAYSGSETLKDNLKKAYDGSSNLYDGMLALQNGANTLSAGITTALEGVEKMETEVSTAPTGASQIAASIGAAAAGSGKISGGVSTMISALKSDTTLATAIATLGGSVQKLQSAASVIYSGLTTSDLINKTGGIQSQLGKMNTATSDATAQMSALLTTYPDLATNENFITLQNDLNTLSTTESETQVTSATLAATCGSLQSGLSGLYTGITTDLANGITGSMTTVITNLSTIKTNIDALTTNLNTLKAYQDTLATKLSALPKGISNLVDGLKQLQSGAQKLSAGVSTAASGTKDLNEGLGKLHGGGESLVSGLWTLFDGGQKLSNGLNDLDDGSGKLADGLGDASSGSNELYTKLNDGYIKSVEKLAQDKTDKEKPVMADPISFNEELVDPVQTYGAGFSPYFIPLALWVGAMAIFLVLPEISRTEIKKRGFRWMSGEIIQRYLLLAGIGIIQALVLCTVLTKGLGLQPNHPELFYGFCILISLLSFAIFTFLCTTIGLAGDFIGIIVLMLQITSAGGSFPKETLPDFFLSIRPYLPMTYSVAALRDIISGNQINVSSIVNGFSITIAILLCSTLVFKWLLSARVNTIGEETVLEAESTGGELVEGQQIRQKHVPTRGLTLTTGFKAFAFSALKRLKHFFQTALQQFKTGGIKLCLMLGILVEEDNETFEENNNVEKEKSQPQKRRNFNRIRMMGVKLNQDFKLLAYRGSAQLKQNSRVVQKRASEKNSKLRSKLIQRKENYKNSRAEKNKHG